MQLAAVLGCVSSHATSYQRCPQLPRGRIVPRPHLPVRFIAYAPEAFRRSGRHGLPVALCCGEVTPRLGGGRLLDGLGLMNSGALLSLEWGSSSTRFGDVSGTPRHCSSCECSEPRDESRGWRQAR